MTRTHARFTAMAVPPHDEEPYDKGDLWPEPEGPLPAGKPFARRLDKALRGNAWHIDYRWSTDYSHAFDARRQKERFDVMVELLDEEAGHYKVTVAPRTGLFPRVRGKAIIVEELQRLALDVHSALTNDPEVSDLVWYEGDDPTDGAEGP